MVGLELPWSEIKDLPEEDPSNRRFSIAKKAIASTIHASTSALDQNDMPDIVQTETQSRNDNRSQTTSGTPDNVDASIPGLAASQLDTETIRSATSPQMQENMERFKANAKQYKYSKNVSQRAVATVKPDKRLKTAPFQYFALMNKPTDVTLTIENTPATRYQLPAFTMYDAYGKTHDIVFQSHHPNQTEFWKRNLEYIQASYIDGKPPHVHDMKKTSRRLSSIFTIVKHNDIAGMSVHDKLNLFRRGLVLEIDRPIDATSFDKAGFKKIGCSSSKIVTIQDQSIDGSVTQNDWLRQGTLGLLLKARGLKGLNVLDLPTPGGKQSAEDFSSDIAAWQEASHSVWNIETKATFPVSDTRWALISVSPCGHTYHVDSNGFGTYIEVVHGMKIWFTMRPKVISDENITNFSEFYKINQFLDSTFDLYDLGSECALEALPLIPGCRLYLRPHTGHAVFTAEDTIVVGGHYYATSTMKDTLCGLILAFSASEYITNTEHLPSRQILRFMMIFYFDGLEQKRFLEDDPVISHLPKLDPLSSASDFNTIHEFKSLFSVCCLAIFSNVLHPLTYLHADEADGNVSAILSDEQLLEMDMFDRNALSIEERNACALSRSLAFSLLEWFTAHYSISCGGENSLDLSTVIDEKIAEQAYAIYCTKQTAEKQGLKGASHCSCATLKHQLMGTFDPSSNIHKILENLFSSDEEPTNITPSFSGYKLSIIKPPPVYTPKAATTYDWMRTPLDRKFQTGYNINFKTTAINDISFHRGPSLTLAAGVSLPSPVQHTLSEYGHNAVHFDASSMKLIYNATRRGGRTI
ncbi:hypothetical protein BDN70DRAFT_901588 [Pholiota conissans]|uniref:JmjC domain-containing protein n=1 Tax=Pholiota conissans TaxID=109636 RepID=A0A9P5YJU0_9AGAR|nr:hypothetical protein BDN70DRAFT_901588 [Pholiota conissans]